MIWFAGDAHGRFQPLIQGVKNHRPEHLIFLGDLECSKPLASIVQPILGKTNVWYIPGNHDVDRQEFWDNLTGGILSPCNLHGRVVMIQGLRIAGLGGVFDKDVWLPPAEPLATSYTDHMTKLEDRLAGKPGPHNDAILASQTLKHRATIFPDDYFDLASQSADILVTHEAPSCHPRGMVAIDELAQAMGVKHVFHGHHHDALDYSTHRDRLGFNVHGVGLCGVTTEDGQPVIPGLKDKERGMRASE